MKFTIEQNYKIIKTRNLLFSDIKDASDLGLHYFRSSEFFSNLLILKYHPGQGTHIVRITELPKEDIIFLFHTVFYDQFQLQGFWDLTGRLNVFHLELLKEFDMKLAKEHLDEIHKIQELLNSPDIEAQKLGVAFFNNSDIFKEVFVTFYDSINTICLKNLSEITEIPVVKIILENITNVNKEWIHICGHWLCFPLIRKAFEE